MWKLLGHLHVVVNLSLATLDIVECNAGTDNHQKEVTKTL